MGDVGAEGVEVAQKMWSLSFFYAICSLVRNR